MTEEEEFYYNNLSEKQKDLLNTINQDLQKYKTGEYTLLTEIDEKIVSDYLHDNNVYIYTEYKTKINTPFAIMQYVTLYSDETSQLKKADEFLKKYVDPTYEYYFVKNFTNSILFTQKNTRNTLKVLYNYNIDDDNFNFYLIGGNGKNFPVSIEIIKALLTNSNINEIKTIPNCLPNISKSKDTHIELTFNGMKITIEKQ